MIASIVNNYVYPRPDPPHYSATSHRNYLIWIPASEALPSVPCFYFQSSSPSKTRPLIIWSHANACDIGTMARVLYFISRRLNISILVYEYPGYGLCMDEKPSEEKINQHTQQAYDFVRHHLQHPPDRIVFYGHSIGTGTACTMVSSLIQSGVPVGGLILQCPFSSLTELVREKLGVVGRLLPRIGWNNFEAIQTITCPVLFIHGKNDDLIPSHHSVALYTACPSFHKHLSLLDHADHNSIDHRTILRHIQTFLHTYLR